MCTLIDAQMYSVLHLKNIQDILWRNWVNMTQPNGRKKTSDDLTQCKTIIFLKYKRFLKIIQHDPITIGKFSAFKVKSAII